MDLPHKIFYTDNLPENVGGKAKGPFIFLREKYRNDSGIIAHEMQHVHQWWAVLAAYLILLCLSLFIYASGDVFSSGSVHLFITFAPVCVGAHNVLYIAFPAYRLWSEADAYATQLLHYRDDRSVLFAWFIATRYGLKITQQKALEAIKAAE